MNLTYRNLIVGWLLLLIAAPSVVAQTRTARSTANAAIERKINVLLARMTLAEKLGQLQQLDGEANGNFRPEHLEMARKGLLGSTLNVRGAEQVNALQKAALESRLKIPMLYGFDVIHGYRTIFPIPLGETASWDLAGVERNAAVAAAESRAAGVHWTFAPMVDIARDPRWGRIMEGSGEDTFLGSKMAYARVRGFQGLDYSANNRVLATAKHWVGYGAAEAGRDYNTTNLTERALREIYFPPFRAALDAGVGSFMTSFNDLDGVPATANPFVLKKVLRGEWKFDGLVVSDYTAVMELMFHGLAGSEADAAAYALNAGTDMEMVSRFYNQHGAELVREKKLSMPVIDEAVRRVLRIKFRLGLFDHPYSDAELEKREVGKAEYRRDAKTAAERSFVLLKNERGMLPINKNIREFAVIGSLADSKADMNGAWSGDGRPEDPITVLQALRDKFPGKKIRYEPGCDAKCESDNGFAAAVRAVKDSDFAIVVAGESADMSGEATSRSSIDLPGRQNDLIKAIHATGKPYAVVLMNGRPLTINWVAENSPAILETWFAGTMAGPAIVDTLFGDANPGGKLPVTFPRSVGQIPIYYNHKNTGRPFDANNKYTSKYTDIPNTPLYPFGYGLSYTQFRLTNLRVDKENIGVAGSVKVSVDVENAGQRSGDEVVQLYIRDLVATVTRPVRELRGFERVTLSPGRKRRVEFTLTPKELGFYDREMKFTVEPGDFKVFVGTSSEGGLEGSFTVGPSSAEKKNESVKPRVYNEKLPAAPVPAAKISVADDAFLEDLERRSFQFFLDHSDPKTGLTLDRARTTGEAPKLGEDHYRVASIAATGFGLSGLCIAADRNWMPRSQALERAKTTLDFFANRAIHKNGWFYHWMDAVTGERRWNSEISSVDTAILLGGVLTAKNCFPGDKQIGQLADKIYRRVDFKWMLNGDPYLFSHGWRPESGWIRDRWHDYSEQMILNLLAIGSPTHSVPARSWYAWDRTWMEFGKYKYLAAVSPLFIHQFSHAWVDFRGRREAQPPNVDYYENSVKATMAQRDFFIEVLAKDFPKYSANIWGLTASDSQKGYVAWGAPPRHEAIDGTVVPCAPAGSLMFAPDITLPALKEMKAKYGDQIYGKYGFADAFNPHNGWINPDVIGIDLGITLLSAENLRSGKVWFWFMLNPELQYAMRAAQLTQN
ncbi:MAG: glycoside hydrolase family 3 N-terminal domain-containing protein [Acidobacteriota bacterium]